jgi:hypothetical protein
MFGVFGFCLARHWAALFLRFDMQIARQSLHDVLAAQAISTEHISNTVLAHRPIQFVSLVDREVDTQSVASFCLRVAGPADTWPAQDTKRLSKSKAPIEEMPIHRYERLHPPVRHTQTRTFSRHLIKFPAGHVQPIATSPGQPVRCRVTC